VGSYGLNDERAGVTGSADKWTYALTGENNFKLRLPGAIKILVAGGGLDVGYDASELLNVFLRSLLQQNRLSNAGRPYEGPDGTGQAAIPASNTCILYCRNSDDDGSDKYTNANLSIKSLFGSLGEIDIHFLYGNKDIQTNMKSWSMFSNTRMDTYGITPKYILAKEIFGLNNKLILGLDYYNEPYKKDFFSSRERTAKISTADLTRDSLGYYARDEFSLLKTLILSAGIDRSGQASRGPMRTWRRRPMILQTGTKLTMPRPMKRV